MGVSKGSGGKAGGKGSAKAGAGILSSATKNWRKANRVNNAGGVQKPPKPPKPMSGPVDIKVPSWATPTQKAQFAEYVKGSNDALAKGKLSKNGRSPTTKNGVRADAERQAALERDRAAKAGNPYQGIAAHIPDATWLGHGKPHQWGDHDSRVNSSIAGQQNRYPHGYKPTGFRLQ